MRINRERKKAIESITDRVREEGAKRFNMIDAKLVNIPLGGHFMLSEAHTPMTEDEKALMSKVLYASTVGNLMYAMICTRQNIAQVVKVVSRYMSNPGKEHWRAVK